MPTTTRRPAITAGRVQASPFLPDLPAVALGDLGRVKFPPTRTDGLLSLADRDPRANRPTVYGVSDYTKPPTPTRIGGPFPVRLAAL